MSRRNVRQAKSLRAAPGKSTRVKKNKLKTRQGYALMQSPRTIMPQEFDTTLKYIVSYTVSNVGNPLASLRLTSNAFDVDPALGSTAMAGFTEFAGFYARFRTIGMKYRFNCNNNELFPVSVIHGFSNTVIASGSLGMNYGENPLFRTDILGPLTGQGRSKYQRSESIVNIAGTAIALYDDSFTGSTSSNTLPVAGTCHSYIGFAAPSVFTAAGVLVQVQMDLHIRFYRPNFLVT
jgi:hypothetical protein